MGRPKGSGKGLPFHKPFPMEERMSSFWNKVDKRSENDCWEWRGMVDAETGYGRFCWNRKANSAHRFAYMSTRGAIPPGKYVCHMCDNRLCQNPDHLFVGTATDNNRDMFRKGRGSKPPSAAKITSEQVVKIRELWVPYKVTRRHISELLGLPYKSVESATTKSRWKTIPWN
jgi:hypothetical protein